MPILRMVLLAIIFLSALSTAAMPTCTPLFSSQKGERFGFGGADVAFSIPLADGRDLWIFGDTLYGEKRVVNAGIPVMVRNSVGVSTCGPDGRWRIDYAIRRDSKDQVQDFFQAQHPHTWYWAMDGFRAGRDVWITLLCVRATDATSAIGFETCGSDLARISNPGPDPMKWKISYFSLVPDGAHACPSATAVIDGNFVNLFALYEKDSRPLLVTRISLKKGLKDPQRHLQYLARDGEWKNGFDPSNAKPIMAQGSPELSIRYHPELKRWIAVMFEPGLSRNIVIRSAPSLLGPWSDGKFIYTAPEMTPANAEYDKDTFCYAGKEHPEFEQRDLVFTYVCNTFAVPKLVTEPNIYLPKTVRMAIPDLPSSEPKATTPAPAH